MKIGIIMVLPIEYDTSAMLRCKEIIFALSKLGNEVTCFCPMPNRKNKYYNSNSMDLSKIQIKRFKRMPIDTSCNDDKKNNSKKKIRSAIKEFCLKAFRKVDIFGSTLLFIPERKWIARYFSENDYDILISFSDPIPAHMIGNYVKKRNSNIRYIQQWGDPLAGNIVSKNAQPIWVRKIIERSLLKEADTVCYVSPFTYEEQKNFFPDQKEKMIFLPSPCLKVDAKDIKKERLCIGYFGSYYSIARNLLPLYHAAVQNEEVDFLIVGDSDIELKSTKNVTIIQRMDNNELKKYMQKVSVLVCLMNRKGNQIPGKVYHDAGSTKDILFIKDGEYGDKIQKFFEPFNHYTFVDNSTMEISKIIKEYVKYGVPYREPVKDFEALEIAKKLID